MLHTTPLPHCSRLPSESHCSTAPPSRGPHRGARALRPSSPNLFQRRSTCVTVLLTRMASARACRVGTTHMAKWTAAAALCIVSSSACLAQTCTRNMPRLSLVPSHVRSSCHHAAHPLLNIFVCWFASTLVQQFIPKSLTAIPFEREYIHETSYPIWKKDVVPERVVIHSDPPKC